MVFRLLFLLCFAQFLWSIPINAQNISNEEIDEMVYEAFDLQDNFPDSALQLSRKVYQLAETNNYNKGRAYALMRMGSIYNLKGINDSALTLIRNAYIIRNRIQDYSGAIGACRVLGDIHREIGNVDSSFYYLIEARKLSESFNDSTELILTNLELGNLSVSYDQMQNAKSYLQKAEVLAINKRDSESLSYIYSGWGNFCFKTEAYKKALKQFQESLNIAVELEDNYLIFNCYSNIALCYGKLKQYKLSSLFYSKALEKAVELNLLSDQALILFNIGHEYINRNLPDSAIFYFNKSLDIAKLIDDTYRESRNYQLLSDSYGLKKDYENAYRKYLIYSKLKDSLLTAEKISSISEMQTKYETEKKEQQIVLLDEQNKTQKAERNYIVASSAVLLLLLLISGLYYYQRSRIAIKNEKIAQQELESVIDEQEIKTYNAMLEGQEEERMRIATDLHDRLGSMLSTVKLLFSSLEEKFDKAQEENQKQYNKANVLLDDACVEIRRISHNLGTGMVANFGLKRAIEELCESVDQSGKINCKALVYGIEKGIPLAIETGIYRMVQEAFNNTIKHAKAENLTVQLNKLEDTINVIIEDDGVGFDLEKQRKAEGMGLSNLEKRAKKLGGELHIDSKKGRGTTIIIDLPLNLQA